MIDFLNRYLLKILGILAILALLIGSPILLQREGFFRIQSVSVRLNEGVMMPGWLEREWKTLEQKAQALKGRDLWKMELGDVESLLKTQPWIREVSLSRAWPSGLIISIDVKELKATARNGKGELIPILEDGQLLPIEKMASFVSLPMLSGEIDIHQRDQVAQALKILAQFPGEGVLSVDRVSEIGFHPQEGYWVLVMPFATKVRLGHNDVEKKISRVIQVMEYLDSRHIGARVIDADLSKKVVVRLRKTP